MADSASAMATRSSPDSASSASRSASSALSLASSGSRSDIDSRTWSSSADCRRFNASESACMAWSSRGAVTVPEYMRFSSMTSFSSSEASSSSSFC